MTQFQEVVDPHLVALAEGVEAEWMFQFEAIAPGPAASDLGIATRRLGGGVALSMRHDPTGYWSKALGFGLDEPVTDDLIREILDFYREQGNAVATVQLAPSVLPADWPQIIARHDLRPGGQIVKLACRAEEFSDRPSVTRLRVEPVRARDALAWATVVVRGFGMPTDGGLAETLAAVVDHPSVRPFAAWDDDEIVGGANLFIDQQVGSLNSGSTLPSHRNQGAQSALIAARARAAVDAGCRWLVAEAGKPPAGSTNPSLNNLVRAGLHPLYDRQDWNWNPATT
jgi:GNAT superfamily N-acetyltransferase